MDADRVVAEFTGLVRNFCHVSEHCFEDREKEIELIREIVAALYASAFALPMVDGEIYESPKVGEGISQAIFQRFGSLPFNYYNCIDTPHAIPARESSVGDLADDLRDIYVDLKSGLFFYDAGDVEQAVLEWKSSFHFHWGQHAVNVLYVLHCYRSRARHDL